MKKGLARVLTIIALIAMVASLLHGCGGQRAPSSGTASTGTVRQSEALTSSSAKEELKPVTLRYYFPGDKKSAADEVWNALADKFKDQLNCTYEVNWVQMGDYTDKLIVMASSGDNWDMNYDGPWLAYTQMQSMGAYMDIKDLMPKYAPDLYQKYQEVGTLEPATVGGKIVALPWVLSHNLRPWLNWRSDITQKAGLDIQPDSIKTLEDVDKVLHDMKKAVPDKTIFAVSTVLLGQVFDITLLRDGYMSTEFHNLYVKVDDPECKLIPIETTPVFKETVKLTRKWVEDGIIAADEMVDVEDAATKWLSGKVITRITTHEYSHAANTFKDNPEEGTRDASELYPDNKFFNHTPLGNCMCVNKNAANPERALMWMNMLETDREFYDMVIYGVEDKTYVLDGETAVFPEGMTEATSNYMNWPGQWTLWKPQFMRPDSVYSRGFWEREAEYANKPVNIVSPIDGLFFDTTSIKNEIARRDQLYEEYGKPLVFGAVKADGIDNAISDYISRQEAAGLDKILTECQKQVDAFLANKE